MASARHGLMLCGIAACTPHAQPAMPGGPGSGEAPEEPIDWLEDNWTTTAAACEYPEPFAWPETPDGHGFDWDWQYYLLEESACTMAIRRDLGIDLDSFGIDDPMTWPDDGYSDGEEAYFDILFEAWTLLALEAGTVDDIWAARADSWTSWGVRDDFRDQLTAAGDVLEQNEVRQIAYNIVTSSILEVRYADDYEDERVVAHVTTDGSRVMTTLPTNEFPTGLTLVHEAAHLYRDAWHVECPDTVGHGSAAGGDLPGRVACDVDRSGAWGFEVALYSLYFDHWTDQYPSDSTWGSDPEGQGYYWAWDARRQTIFIIEEWTEEGGIWYETGQIAR